jgi:Flp pilus assembly protein RcpC/CpaB
MTPVAAVTGRYPRDLDLAEDRLMSRITTVASGLLIGGLLFGMGGVSPGDDQPDVSPGPLPPVGSRVITLPIAIDRAVSGFLKPGVRVDIIGRDEGRYKGVVVVPDVMVYQVRDEEGDGELQLTFQVSPLQASVLDLLHEKLGKLSISLRNTASEKRR